jgi:hypothetical protein
MPAHRAGPAVNLDVLAALIETVEKAGEEIVSVVKGDDWLVITRPKPRQPRTPKAETR